MSQQSKRPSAGSARDADRAVAGKGANLDTGFGADRARQDTHEGALLVGNLHPADRSQFFRLGGEFLQDGIVIVSVGDQVRVKFGAHPGKFLCTCHYIARSFPAFRRELRGLRRSRRGDWKCSAPDA